MKPTIAPISCRLVAAVILLGILVCQVVYPRAAAAESWVVQNASPGYVEWQNSLHPSLTYGNYLKINGIFYFVRESGNGSWNGPEYAWARLQRCEQTSGAPLYDPLNPSQPQYETSADLSGTAELFPGWPAPGSGWTIHSVRDGDIDWYTSQHEPLATGSYVLIANQFYYVTASGSGSWSGPEFSFAALAQVNQICGAVLFDPMSPSIPLRPNLTGMEGQQIQLGAPPVRLSFPITAVFEGHGTIACESPVMMNASATCTITPDPGYVLERLIDNGMNVTYQVNGGSLTIPIVTDPHYITATFGLKPYARLWKQDLPVFATASDMTVDGKGNIYIVGSALDGYTVNSGRNISVAKYAPSGTKLWIRLIGTTTEETAKAIAVDGAGNIIVTGDTSGNYDGKLNSGNGDVFLLKLDPNGNKIWSRLIARCRSSKISVSSGGEIYLAGTTQYHIASPTAQGEILMMRYDANGNRLWASQHTLGHSVTAMTLDASGNAYISGSLIDDYEANGYDLYVARISGQGNKVWSYVTSETRFDDARGIAVDSNGDLSLLTNYAVERNNTSGNFFDNNIWRNRDEDRAMTIGHDGNLYLAGYSNGVPFLEMFNLHDWSHLRQDLPITPTQSLSPMASLVVTDSIQMLGLQNEFVSGEGYSYYFLTKLGALPQPVDSPLFSTITSPADGTSLQGTNLEITGTARNDSGSGILLVEVSLDDGLTWQSATDLSGDGSWGAWRFTKALLADGSYLVRSRVIDPTGVAETPGAGIALNIDSTGPVPSAVPPGGNFQAPQSVTLLTTEPATIHFTVDGSEPTTSSPIYSTPLTISATTRLRFLAVDSLGNEGQSQTEEYTVSGVASWVTQFGLLSACGYAQASALIAGESGSIYLAGRATGTIDASCPDVGGGDAYLLKYDQAGNRIWTRQIATTGNEYGYQNMLARDSQGNIVLLVFSSCNLTDNTCSGTSQYNRYLVKYSPNGERLYLVPVSYDGYSTFFAMAADGSGNIYLAGKQYNTHPGSAATNDTLLNKYDANGTLIWSRQYFGNTGYYQYAYGMAIDGTDNVFLTGVHGSYYTGDDLFLMKLSPEGTPAWKVLGTYSNVGLNGLAMDQGGNLFVAGTTTAGLDGNQNSGGRDAFIIKYDPTGTRVWTRQLGSPYDETVSGITADSDGSVLINGIANGELQGVSNSGKGDLFLARYDNNGAILWATQLGTGKNESTPSFALTPTGDIFLSGTTDGALDGVTRSCSPFNDMAIIKLATPDIPAAADAPPETFFTVTPESVTHVLSADFDFGSNDPAAVFECRLDYGSYFPCSPPYSLGGFGWGGHSLEVRAKNVSGKVDPSPARHEWAAIQRLALTATKSCDGSGRVLSTPAGIDLQGGLVASAIFDSGSMVYLTATPAADSVFTGWSGACSGLGTCFVAIRTDTQVSASFCKKPLGAMGPVRTVEPTVGYYQTYQAAYNNLQAGGSATIQSSSGTSTEDVSLNKPISITLKGGYDPSFSTASGYSEVRGKLTVADGTVTVEGITIK